MKTLTLPDSPESLLVSRLVRAEGVLSPAYIRRTASGTIETAPFDRERHSTSFLEATVFTPPLPDDTSAYPKPHFLIE